MEQDHLKLRRIGAFLAAAMMLIASASLSVGCATSDEGQPLRRAPGPGLTPQPRATVADVPMPVGFVLVETASRSWREDDSLYTQFLFQGWANLADTVDYFRRQMQISGWRPVDEQFDQTADQVIMRFQRDKAALALQIAPGRRTIYVWVQKRRDLAD